MAKRRKVKKFIPKQPVRFLKNGGTRFSHMLYESSDEEDEDEDEQEEKEQEKPLFFRRNKKPESQKEETIEDFDEEDLAIQEALLYSALSSRTISKQSSSEIEGDEDEQEEREKEKPLFFSRNNKQETLEDFDEEDLAIQEALLYSALCSRTIEDFPKKTQIDLKRKGKIDSSFSINYRYFDTYQSNYERGESSHSYCVICNDKTPTGSMLFNNKCSHSFCKDCIFTYLGEKLQENISKVKCPESKCKCVLKSELISQIVPEEVNDRRKSAIIEASVLGCPRILRCPFEDCLENFLDDGKGFLIRACPKCWRIFCVQCESRYHGSIPCWVFQVLERERKRGRTIIIVKRL